jgi:protein-L-isoaspartate(D-aspartate) O-methyltransferase
MHSPLQRFVLIFVLCALECQGGNDRASSLSAARTPPSRQEVASSMNPTAAPRLAAIDTPAQQQARSRMVREQVEARGVHDARVLAALRAVPRHAFVADAYRRHAYDDEPLPIDAHQTISQPYIVGLMTELAQIAPGDKVLEVGTGSGYQAAVLAELGAEVYSIEIVEELARSAGQRLRALGYAVQVRHGDGYAGWPEAAPFNAILVTAAPPSVPAPLRSQLALGGRMIIPVGESYQDLLVITRTAHGYQQKNVLPVRFVPMTGKAQARP